MKIVLKFQLWGLFYIFYVLKLMSAKFNILKNVKEL